MATVCKQTSLHFSPYSPSKSKNSGEIPINKIQIKLGEVAEKEHSSTLENIQTERTRTNGLGFYPKKYSSLKKKNEELSSRESQSINAHHPGRKRSKEKQKVMIAFNYTNYYLNAHLFKKKSFQKSTGHTYTQQKNPQSHDEELVNTWSKKARNFNSSIYNMLKDHKKKLKKNHSEEEPYSSLLTEQPNKIKLNVVKPYESKLNLKTLTNYNQDTKILLPPYQQNGKKRKSFPSNQKFSKKGYHNSLMKQKIQRCYQQKDYQERMLTVGNFQSELVPESFRRLEIFQETLQRMARNKSHGIQLPMLNANSERNIPFDLDNQLQNNSEHIHRDKQFSPSKEPSNTQQITHRKFETERQTLQNSTKTKKFYSYIQHKNSNRNSHKSKQIEIQQFIPQLSGWETRQNQDEEFL